MLLKTLRRLTPRILFLFALFLFVAVVMFVCLFWTRLSASSIRFVIWSEKAWFAFAELYDNQSRITKFPQNEIRNKSADRINKLPQNKIRHNSIDRGSQNVTTQVRLAFVILWFGDALPKYADLFLASAVGNPDVDFFLYLPNHISDSTVPGDSDACTPDQSSRQDSCEIFAVVLSML